MCCITSSINGRSAGFTFINKRTVSCNDFEYLKEIKKKKHQSLINVTNVIRILN